MRSNSKLCLGGPCGKLQWTHAPTEPRSYDRQGFDAKLGKFPDISHDLVQSFELYFEKTPRSSRSEERFLKIFQKLLKTSCFGHIFQK